MAGVDMRSCRGRVFRSTVKKVKSYTQPTRLVMGPGSFGVKTKLSDEVWILGLRKNGLAGVHCFPAFWVPIVVRFDGYCI